MFTQSLCRIEIWGAWMAHHGIVPVLVPEAFDAVFISYGQPDDAFARRLYESLTVRRVTAYYFPETARPGERLSNELRHQIKHHERFLLLCSEASLNRAGVRNEIQETFDREARDGGASYLIPILLDDYLFDPDGWHRVEPDLAEAVQTRSALDFRRALGDSVEYESKLNRLLDVLDRSPRLPRR